MPSQNEYVRVAVLCTNSEGKHEFHTCQVLASPEAIEEGAHLEEAKENASLYGFDEPMMAIETFDPAATQANMLSWVGRKDDGHPELDLLPQCFAVSELLQACVEALKYLPSQVAERLLLAAKEFENVTSVTTWSVEDVDTEDEFEMSLDEKRQVIASYAERYEVSSGEWARIEKFTNDVVAERKSVS